MLYERLLTWTLEITKHNEPVGEEYSNHSTSSCTMNVKSCAKISMDQLLNLLSLSFSSSQDFQEATYIDLSNNSLCNLHQFENLVPKLINLDISANSFSDLRVSLLMNI